MSEQDDIWQNFWGAPPGKLGSEMRDLVIKHGAESWVVEYSPKHGTVKLTSIREYRNRWWRRPLNSGRSRWELIEIAPSWEAANRTATETRKAIRQLKIEAKVKETRENKGRNPAKRPRKNQSQKSRQKNTKRL